uniref:Aladin n=1 Tax=Rhizophora mucronata TaxID=61149 RepID=A0A2P2MB10_RHIMU
MPPNPRRIGVPTPCATSHMVNDELSYEADARYLPLGLQESAVTCSSSQL